MRESISTSKSNVSRALIFGAAFFLVMAIPQAYSQETPPQDDRSLRPEEDDFSNSGYTNYGETDEEETEAEEVRFFQYGRLFGISLGAGFHGASGNRGALWQGGAPTIDLKVHYWFDFNFALALAVMSAPHFYEAANPKERKDVSLVRLGADLKYYFDTKNVSAALSFSNPYVLLGVGSFSKTETTIDDGGTDEDGSFGFTLGAGLEFPISPKKSYFYVEGKFHHATFKDTNTGRFAGNDPDLPDLSGFFYSITGGLLFTW